MPDNYRVATLEDMDSPMTEGSDTLEWKPVRYHLGISAFGINAGVARQAGVEVIDEHTETESSSAGHEELYFVARGHARFFIEGKAVDAPSGTFVFVPDPQSLRSARSLEPDTRVICIGAPRGKPFEVAPWEHKHWKTRD